jgi:hypothetical protein
VAQGEEVHRRDGPRAERGRQRALRRQNAGHLERGGVGQDADYGQAHMSAGLGIADVDDHGREVLVLDVEAF